MKTLEGKVAIVTGATKAKGLGKAIAIQLAAQGAKVALTGRQSSKEGVEKNVAQIKADGGEAMVVDGGFTAGMSMTAYNTLAAE